MGRVIFHSTVPGSMVWMEKTYIKITPLPSVLTMEGVLNLLELEAFATICAPEKLKNGVLADGPSVDEMLVAAVLMWEPVPATRCDPTIYDCPEDFREQF